MTAPISLDEYRASFKLTGQGFDDHDPDRALLQLGMPSTDSVALWFVPRRGEAPELHVRVSPLAPTGGDREIEVSQERAQVSERGPLRVVLRGLVADRAYRLQASFGEGGGERTQVLEARTAPAADDKAPFSFLSSSCIQPFREDAGGAFLPARTIRSLELYRRRAVGLAAQAPAFALGLGDQIYVDSGRRAMLKGWHRQHARYAPGEAQAFFEVAYRAQFSLPPLQAAREALPSALMWDDHEIRDGWGAQGDENAQRAGKPRWEEHLRAARAHFIGWQCLRNPTRRGAPTVAARALPGADLTASPELDFEMDWGGGASFFVMDQRSARSASARRVVSAEQLERLHAWLHRQRANPTLMVLGSAMPLTQLRRPIEIAEYFVPARRDDLLDSWWSKPCRAQRDQILELLREFFDAHRQHRLLIVSGDVHFSEVLELSDSQGRVFGHEVVSSGVAHDKFHRLGRRSPQGRRKSVASGVHSAALGSFHGPCFAELFVTPTHSGPPQLEVTFHVAVTADGKALANAEGAMPPRLTLPLSPVAGRLEDLSERFVLRPERGSSPQARADTFE